MNLLNLPITDYARVLVATANYEQLHIDEAIQLFLEVYSEQALTADTDTLHAQHMTNVVNTIVRREADTRITGGWSDNGYGEGCYGYELLTI